MMRGVFSLQKRGPTHPFGKRDVVDVAAQMPAIASTGSLEGEVLIPSPSHKLIKNTPELGELIYEGTH